MDGQDAAAVPGAGVGVVERVGGLDGGSAGLGDVAAAASAASAAVRADRPRRDAAERDPRRRRTATVTIDARVLLAAHRLACRTSARGTVKLTR